MILLHSHGFSEIVCQMKTEKKNWVILLDSSSYGNLEYLEFVMYFDSSHTDFYHCLRLLTSFRLQPVLLFYSSVAHTNA